MNSAQARSEGVAWRPAFALRVLTLALLMGTLARDTPLREWAFATAMLAVVGFTASLVHLRASVRTIGLVPLFEALACVVVVSVTPGAPGLLGYLAVPPLAAGLSSGPVRCASSGVVALLALTGALLTPGVPLSQHDAGVGGLWVLLGMVAGLVASWQTRGERAISQRQSQALQGRDLLARFEATMDSSEALDFEAQARLALDQLLLHTTAVAGLIVLTDGFHTRILASSGRDDEALKLARQCGAAEEVVSHGDLLAVPVAGTRGSFGAVVLRSSMTWTKRERRSAEQLAGELAIPLDMALLFSRITDRATAAERSRLAREIHDTVAQDIASLGYAVDGLARASEDPEVEELAADLRAEITRIVGELRYSIFDLRAGELSLAATIAPHARQAAERAGLELHLDLDPVRLPSGQETVATHLRRIAQEAVTNTARHAHARHLWVRLRRVSEGQETGLRLEIEDDGVGMGAQPVPSGFGMESMRERADAIGAKLEHSTGAQGGTVVRVELPTLPLEATL